MISAPAWSATYTPLDSRIPGCGPPIRPLPRSPTATASSAKPNRNAKSERMRCPSDSKSLVAGATSTAPARSIGSDEGEIVGLHRGQRELWVPAIDPVLDE